MSDFIKAHVRLVVGLAISLGLIFGVYKYLSHRADVTTEKAQVAQVKAEAQHQANVQTATVVAAQEKKYQAVVKRVVPENKALIEQADKVLEQVSYLQAEVKAEPAVKQAERWVELSGQDAGQSSVSDAGVTLTLPAFTATVQQMEWVKPLKDTVDIQNRVISNKDEQINSLTDLNAALTKQVNGLHDEIVLDNTAAATALTAEKAKNRKSKLKWFGAGVAVGTAVVVTLIVKK